MAVMAPGRARQNRIYRNGVSGRRPSVPVTADGLERAAEKALSAKAFGYLAGGAGAERTMTANQEAFGRRRIVPRVLRDVSARDLSVELFGRRLPAPLLLAPIGVLELAHRDADLAAAKAAAATGVPMIFSNQASVPMETCAAAMGDAPRWFQLYWSTDEDLVDSFLARAEAVGAEALVLTLDTTMLGWRPRDLDLGSLPFARGQGIAQYTSDPVFRRLIAERPSGDDETPAITPAAVRTFLAFTRRYPGGFLSNLRSPLPRAAVQTFLDIYSRPSLTWNDVAGLRNRTTLPIVLKGVLHPDDAKHALDAGVSGIVVSNHGGRQVDGSISSLEALPRVVEAVGGQIPVLLDSGVRGGADVVKAVSLGAAAVLLGRPYAFGLALAGEDGVREVIENVLAELDLTLGLAGCTSIAELGPHVLDTA